jgi:hypothetical protein
MATTYAWDIQQVELVSTGNFNQVVHRCFWKCTATADSGAKKEQFGVIDLDISNLDPATFKTFDTLTTDDIVAWVKSVVHTTSVEAGLHPESVSHSFVAEVAPVTVQAETTST